MPNDHPNAKQLLRPLRFAVKDQFINLPKMVGLGTLCSNLLQGLSADLPEAKALSTEFARFDQQSLDARRLLVQKTLGLIEGFLEETPTAVELPKPPVDITPPATKAAEEGPTWNQTAEKKEEEVPKPKKVKPAALPLDPNDSIDKLAGVGPQVAAKLKEAGITTVRDLMQLTPRRYVDLRGTLPVAMGKSFTKDGGDAAEGSITGQITASRMGFGKGGRRFEVEVTIPEESVKIRAYYFRVNSGYAQKFTKSHWVTLAGKMTKGSRGLQMVHPKTILHGENPPDIENTSGSLDVFYSEIDGLPSKTLTKLIRSATERAASQVEDPLPEAIRREFGLLNLGEALLQVHLPSGTLSATEIKLLQEGSHPARRRLAFDELFTLQLGLAIRAQHQQTEKALAVPIKDWEPNPTHTNTPTSPAENDGVIENGAIKQHASLPERLTTLLPFQMTGAQTRAVRDVLVDLQRATPMNRMLVGEVGSGKTAVALSVAIPVLEAGMQVALMAPTEILAVQHAERLLPLIRKTGHELALITAGTSRSHKSSRTATAAGMANFVIGTHALLEDAISFRKLALVIIDEQHRFGVEQRARLIRKGELRPHLLVMTATPIPRSMALTLYGDLDLSVLDELPPGRTPIQSAVIPSEQRDQLFVEIEEEVKLGGQVFVICPLVEESEGLDAPNAKNTAAELAEKFPNLRIGLLHGRLTGEERSAVMRSFARGLCHILVATTVVEVGVDVPNASLMIILGAERFGMSQLHQLRGRVGRGSRPSRCLLWPSTHEEDNNRRLKTLAATHDGFRLAEEDLRQRGPGEFLGTKQSGAPDLAMIDLFKDAELLSKARNAARAIATDDPHLIKKEHQNLKQLLKKRLGDWAEAWLS